MNRLEAVVCVKLVVRSPLMRRR